MINKINLLSLKDKSQRNRRLEKEFWNRNQDWATKH